MARSQTSVSVTAAATSSAKAPKKSVAVTKGNGRVQKKPTTHPPVYEMIVAALKALKARKGSSLYAIKNYIGANYQCSVDKLSPFIKKALKSGIEKGTLIRTTGIGATGSFKLANNQALTERKVMAAPAPKTGTMKRPRVPKQSFTTPVKVTSRRPKTPMPKKGAKAGSTVVE